jgi:hypothetical protein
MIEGAELRCSGVRLENRKFLDLAFCKNPRSKFVWLGRTCKLHNRGRTCKLFWSEALRFGVRDFVYLKVPPMRGLHRFKVQGKLALRFIGPFKILEKRGEVAYQLELLPQLSNMHDVFHVSQLKKCLRVPEEQLPMEDLDAKEDLSYQEYPVQILETSQWVTRNKKIKMCQVQWSHRTEEEATWEREEELKKDFPSFFSDPSESQGRDSF